MPTPDDVYLEVPWPKVVDWWQASVTVARDELHLAHHEGEEDVLILTLDRELAGFVDLVILPYSLDDWLGLLRSRSPEA